MKDTSSTLRDSSSALARMRRRCAARSSELRWCLSAVRAATGLGKLLVGSTPYDAADGSPIADVTHGQTATWGPHQRWLQLASNTTRQPRQIRSSMPFVQDSTQGLHDVCVPCSPLSAAALPCAPAGVLAVPLQAAPSAARPWHAAALMLLLSGWGCGAACIRQARASTRQPSMHCVSNPRACCGALSHAGRQQKSMHACGLPCLDSSACSRSWGLQVTTPEAGCTGCTYCAAEPAAAYLSGDDSLWCSAPDAVEADVKLSPCSASDIMLKQGPSAACPPSAPAWCLQLLLPLQACAAAPQLPSPCRLHPAELLRDSLLLPCCLPQPPACKQLLAASSCQLVLQQLVPQLLLLTCAAASAVCTASCSLQLQLTSAECAVLCMGVLSAGLVLPASSRKSSTVSSRIRSVDLMSSL